MDIPAILAHLHEQESLIEQAKRALTQLNELQGSSPFLQLPTHRNGRRPKRTSVRRSKKKRSTRSPAQMEVLRLAREKARLVRTRRPRKSQRKGRPHPTPAVNERSVPDYILAALTAARVPLKRSELANQMIAAGWTTNGNARNVVTASVYTLRKQGKVRVVGKNPNQLIILPTWKSAMIARRQLEQTGDFDPRTVRAANDPID